MKRIGKMCIAAVVLVLGACTPYDPFDLSTGKITAQEALGYQSDAPYMAVTARSKHYQITDSSSYFSRLYDGTTDGAKGNGNKVLNPGETVIYELSVANYGKKPAYSVSAAITTDDKYVSNMANTSGDIGHFKERGRYSPDYRTIFAGYGNDKNLRFTVSPDTPPGHVIKFEIVFSDASYNTWRDYFLLTVYK
jgi:hypothetical protein